LQILHGCFLCFLLHCLHLALSCSLAQLLTLPWYHTSWTMPISSSLEFGFKWTFSMPTSTFGARNRSLKSCSMWTPSSTKCLVVYNDPLVVATPLSLESLISLGAFQTLYKECLPFKMRYPQIVSSRIGLPFPTHLLHGHHILVMPCCWAHDTSLAHNLSSLVVSLRGSSSCLLPLAIFYH